MTERMKKLHEDNSGVTLVEMIVTFALVGIFLASAVAVISSAVVTHSELTAAMYAQNIGETLLDKVTGELAAAKPFGDEAILIEGTDEAEPFLGNKVRFFDKDGKQVLCKVQDGLLQLCYQSDQEGAKQTEDSGEEKIEADRWMLDENAYMGFRITDMQFIRSNEKNVIEVSLTIQNLKTGFEYTTSRCTRCYNFKTEEDYGKIVDNTEKLVE